MDRTIGQLESSTSWRDHMDASKLSRSRDRRSRIGRLAAGLILILAGFVAYGTLAIPHGSTVSAQKADALTGMGSLSGTVTAAKPFKAAQVYLRSVDKRRRVQYMVYTNAGKFKAVALFPGNYEIIV